jgi:hypothetical protein
MELGIREKLESTNNCRSTLHTTIAIQKGTKQRLDQSRAPGQCYDGFISELVEYWERYIIGSSLCSPGKPIRQDMER